MMVVYGYSRLVGYDEKLRIVPDILERIENEDEPRLHAAPAPRAPWSDGHPFTADDFRYYWEDVVNNKELSPFGLPQALLVRRQAARASRCSTTRRSATPGTSPIRSSSRCSPGRARCTSTVRRTTCASSTRATSASRRPTRRPTAAGSRSWAGLHQKKDEQYRFDNPDLPTLEPWINTTPLPSTRFVLVRNPYFHRVDTAGRQLPYIDRVIVNISRRQAHPGEDRRRRRRPAGALPALRQLHVPQAEREAQPLPRAAVGEGAGLADGALPEPQRRRPGVADADARRALPPRAVARDQPPRDQRGRLLRPGAASRTTPCCERSPLFRPEFRTAWSKFDVKAANALLDELGLAKRDADGLRLLPDGRPMEIVVDTSGESTEETDVLELVRDSWRKVGIALFSRPSQREVFRKRVFSGQVDDVGLVRARQRHPDAGHEPERARADGAGAAAVADVGAVLREQPQAAARRPTCPRRRSSSRLYDEWRSSRDTMPSARRSGCRCSRSTPSRSSRSAS